MGTLSFTPALTTFDWTDSLYYYVRSRIQAVNPIRVFSGIESADDWPLKEAVPESFYMLTGRLEPIRSSVEGGNSWSGPNYTEQIRWAWQIIGEDVSQNEQRTNRGDRYRKHATLIQELIYGVYPGYLEVSSYSANVDGSVSIVSHTPKDFVRVSKPQFSEVTNNGILFGYGTIQISSFFPEINS